MADIGAGVPLLVVNAAAFALNAGVLEVAIRTRLVAAPGRDSILDGPPCETLPSPSSLRGHMSNHVTAHPDLSCPQISTLAAASDIQLYTGRAGRAPAEL